MNHTVSWEESKGTASTMTQSGCAYEEEGLDCLGLNMEAVRKEIRELAGFLWKVES